MASKFMVNAAFKARLLLRPSHQRTVLFGTVNKLKCPVPDRSMLPQILASRSYSDSTFTPVPPKPSGSSESSRSSRPEDKTYLDSTPTPPFPKSSGPTEGSQSSGLKDKNWFHLKGWGGAVIITVVVVVALTTYATQEIWKDWYVTESASESACESAIYDRLKKGPVFQKAGEDTIPRKPLVEKIRQLITPWEHGSLYSLIIGEPGSGKTNLIKLVVNGMDENEPKGIVYVDIPFQCDLEDNVAEAMREALGWIPDQVIDSSGPASVKNILDVLSRLAIKYKQEYGKVPVLIIDNANTLVEKQQRLLNLFQDYAKYTADEGIISVVFMSNEGVPDCMRRRRSSWSRCGDIIDINDVSKEEALQYLKLREIDEKEAARIYELVGGRIIHLKCTADAIKRAVTLEAIRNTMFSYAELKLKSAGILPGHRYHKDGAKIIRELLKKDPISRNAYYDLVDVDTGLKLLETHVFEWSFDSQGITFRSAEVKRYCEENSALWEGTLW